jgi:hypothetical protein
MKPRGLFAVPALVLVFTTPLAAAAEPTQGVSNAALANAGRQATLKMIDYGTDYCDGALTVEAWLKALVGSQARSIAWSGGQCVLVNDMRPTGRRLCFSQPDGDARRRPRLWSLPQGFRGFVR